MDSDRNNPPDAQLAHDITPPYDYAKACGLTFQEYTFTIELEDGRSLVVPLVWFPVLNDAPRHLLEKGVVMLSGEGLAWDELDEHLAVRGLMQPFRLFHARPKQRHPYTTYLPPKPWQ